MAPGFQLANESAPIAKGLTAKTDELLSKISLTFARLTMNELRLTDPEPGLWARVPRRRRSYMRHWRLPGSTANLVVCLFAKNLRASVRQHRSNEHAIALVVRCDRRAPADFSQKAKHPWRQDTGSG